MKIGLSAIHYPITMARYFWDALDRREDVQVFSVGPFFDDWIPWNHGMRLPRKYVKRPYVELNYSLISREVPYTIVESYMPDDLDLFLVIDAGWHFSTRPKAKVVALIKTDPHALSREYYRVPKSYSDVTFCMQTPYMESDEIYLPYAYDPTVHFPEGLDKRYDVCMIGLQYDHRVRALDRLRSLGVSVYTTIGDVFDEYRRRYNESRVAFCWSSMMDLPARVWEAFGMGLPVVTNRVPDLFLFFEEEKHFLGFDSEDEAVNQVMRLLRDDELRENISKKGREKAKEHTWDARVNQILETVGLS